MIGADLHFQIIDRIGLGTGHHPGIVNQYVEGLVAPALTKGADAGKIGQVDKLDAGLGSLGRLGNIGGNLCPSAGITHGQHHLSPRLGQGPGRLDTNARGRARDNRDLAAQILPSNNFTRGGKGSKRRGDTVGHTKNPASLNG